MNELTRQLGKVLADLAEHPQMIFSVQASDDVCAIRDTARAINRLASAIHNLHRLAYKINHPENK